jgi:hypothetical protein
MLVKALRLVKIRGGTLAGHFPSVCRGVRRRGGHAGRASSWNLRAVGSQHTRGTGTPRTSRYRYTSTRALRGGTQHKDASGYCVVDCVVCCSVVVLLRVMKLLV